MEHASNQDGITRRDALRNIGAAGLAATVAGTGIEALLAQAAAATPKHGTLKDIEHVVILIQENRSFDHYFGTLSGVRGFSDKQNRAAFFQKGLDGNTLHPFHLPSQCLPDITHDWGPQHLSWNGGRMNSFLAQHEKVNGAAIGPETMGYHTRSDIPLYYALADAFTVCDMYFCSVIGPTDPNRLLSMSASLDPAGKHGGPLLQTLVSTRDDFAGKFTWTTMPERLEAHGISWKQYSQGAGALLDSVLPYFNAYRKGTKFYNRGIAPVYPDDFMADIARDRLPQVSWVLLSLTASEHPGYSDPHAGAVGARQVVEALVSNPKVWEKTALFITWDENGGFFDHVPPPTPPRGTRDEFVTVAKLPEAAQGIRGPIGLGFRVPMIVVSPFSRGGLVCSDVFDHTSTLRFLETRFRVGVPNLSAWRRRVTGDLTSAFNFAARPNSARPRLPRINAQEVCPINKQPVEVLSQPFPKQAPGKRRRPSGIVG